MRKECCHLTCLALQSWWEAVLKQRRRKWNIRSQHITYGEWVSISEMDTANPLPTSHSSPFPLALISYLVITTASPQLSVFRLLTSTLLPVIFLHQSKMSPFCAPCTCPCSKLFRSSSVPARLEPNSLGWFRAPRFLALGTSFQPHFLLFPHSCKHVWSGSTRLFPPARHPHAHGSMPLFTRILYLECLFSFPHCKPLLIYGETNLNVKSSAKLGLILFSVSHHTLYRRDIIWQIFVYPLYVPALRNRDEKKRLVPLSSYGKCGADMMYAVIPNICTKGNESKSGNSWVCVCVWWRGVGGCWQGIWQGKASFSIKALKGWVGVCLGRLGGWWVGEHSRQIMAPVTLNYSYFHQFSLIHCELFEEGLMYLSLIWLPYSF